MATAETDLNQEAKGSREPWYEGRFEEGIVLTTVEEAIHWAEQGSLWPVTFGLACCAIEMIATGGSRFDIDRFGAGAFRPSPRQADLMIVAGTVTHKMAERISRLYEQMPEPKYVIAMGACAIGGGPYAKYGYHVVKGVEKLCPVDVYIPGCPPRPEALLEGLMRLQDKVMARRVGRKPIENAGLADFARRGEKVEDTLPLPCTSGKGNITETWPKVKAVRDAEAAAQNVDETTNGVSKNS